VQHDEAGVCIYPGVQHEDSRQHADSKHFDLELEKLQPSLGTPVATPDGTHMLTTTCSSGAQLRSSKQGPYKMQRNPKEPPVLLGKQKINLRANPQGSGLTYLPHPLEEGSVQAATTCPFHLSMCMPFYSPGRCSVHAASWETDPAAPAAVALPGDTRQACPQLGKVHRGPQLPASASGLH